MRWCTFRILPAFVLTSTFIALGGTYYVSPSGSGSDCTQSKPCGFQTALDKAKTNAGDDTIIVAPGTYNINQTLSYEVNDGAGKLTIKAQDPNDKPVLDGKGNMNLMYINSDEDNDGVGDSGNDIVINNLIFRNGSDGSGSGGAGLSINTGEANVKVENCIFIDNFSIAYGGGAAIYSEAGTVECSNNMFFGNGAPLGGGIKVGTFEGKILLLNNIFSGNDAPTIFLDGHGGGAYVHVDVEGAGIITNNTFYQNGCEYRGCGLYVDSGGNLNIYNNIFWNNTIYTNTNPLGEDVAIDINPFMSPTITLKNNNFSGNAIFDESEDQNSDNGILESEDLYISDIIGYYHSSNVQQDPQFVDADGADNQVGTQDDNLRLLATSPLIDRGDNNAPSASYPYQSGYIAFAVPNYDIEGNDRKIDGDGDGNKVVDMGAYEFGIRVKVTKAGQGSGSVASNIGGINCGETCETKLLDKNKNITLTAVANDGSVFDSWEGDCSGCGKNKDCQIQLNADKNCTATFAKASAGDGNGGGNNDNNKGGDNSGQGKDNKKGGCTTLNLPLMLFTMLIVFFTRRRFLG